MCKLLLLMSHVSPNLPQIIPFLAHLPNHTHPTILVHNRHYTLPYIHLRMPNYYPFHKYFQPKLMNTVTLPLRYLETGSENQSDHRGDSKNKMKVLLAIIFCLKFTYSVRYNATVLFNFTFQSSSMSLIAL